MASILAGRSRVASDPERPPDGGSRSCWASARQIHFIKILDKNICSVISLFYWCIRLPERWSRAGKGDFNIWLN